MQQPKSKQPWRSPCFVEVRMNAEIGSYQNELEERVQQRRVARPAKR
ncbi:MAG: hypothetical protein ACM31C_03675 [Acidobacteriota bacterium]